MTEPDPTRDSLDSERLGYAPRFRTDNRGTLIEGNEDQQPTVVRSRIPRKDQESWQTESPTSPPRPSTKPSTGADKPVVVDFWAEWCGPCKKIAPILGEIAGERDETPITKLNVDDNPDIAMKYSVMSIPTLLVFDKGEVVGRITGAKSKGALLEEIDGFLATSR